MSTDSPVSVAAAYFDVEAGLITWIRVTFDPRPLLALSKGAIAG